MKFSKKQVKYAVGVWVVFLTSVGLYNAQDQPALVSSGTQSLAKDKTQGDVRIFSINVHNLFNGQVSDNGRVSFSESRGASSQSEYERDLKQVVKGLDASDAHLLALIEVENDISQSQPVISDIVKKLNEAVKDEGMKFNVVGSASDQRRFGSDRITQFFLYDEMKLKTQGSLQSAFNQAPLTKNRNSKRLGRPILLQKMQHLDSGTGFFVAVSHLKSKRGQCRSDQPGQSPCNQVRYQQVEYISNWITQRTGSKPVFWMGDFNTLPDETPIQLALKEGWSTGLNLQSDYSYIYRGDQQLIDYIFSKNTETLKTSAWVWNINTDGGGPSLESPQTNIQSFSDHDGVILDISF